LAGLANDKNAPIKIKIKSSKVAVRDSKKIEEKDRVHAKRIFILISWNAQFKAFINTIGFLIWCVACLIKSFERVPPDI
jgi:hypothetical protein